MNASNVVSRPPEVNWCIRCFSFNPNYLYRQKVKTYKKFICLPSGSNQRGVGIITLFGDLCMAGGRAQDRWLFSRLAVVHTVGGYTLLPCMYHFSIMKAASCIYSTSFLYF